MKHETRKDKEKKGKENILSTHFIGFHLPSCLLEKLDIIAFHKGDSRSKLMIKLVEQRCSEKRVNRAVRAISRKIFHCWAGMAEQKDWYNDWKEEDENKFWKEIQESLSRKKVVPSKTFARKIMERAKIQVDAARKK